MPEAAYELHERFTCFTSSLVGGDSRYSCKHQCDITCGDIEETSRSSKAIDERVNINLRNKNAITVLSIEIFPICSNYRAVLNIFEIP